MKGRVQDMTEDVAKNWTDERVDNLAALITVTDEQLVDRARAEVGLRTDSPRVRELVKLVFGDEVPSVENYLAAHDHLIAA